jgi:superfamily I DNA/RNA helicase
MPARGWSSRWWRCPASGRCPSRDEPELEEARLFYVAATRSTQSLIVTASGDGGFAARLAAAGV